MFGMRGAQKALSFGHPLDGRFGRLLRVALLTRQTGSGARSCIPALAVSRAERQYETPGNKVRGRIGSYVGMRDPTKVSFNITKAETALKPLSG